MGAYSHTHGSRPGTQMRPSFPAEPHCHGQPEARPFAIMMIQSVATKRDGGSQLARRSQSRYNVPQAG
eukprot:3907611-Rhodomonas_salina.2